MRSLTGSSIPNIDSSDLANYPRGRFKNDSTPTAADGTELSERTLGDLYQAAIELLRLAGITPSETAEKKADSDIADAVGFLKPIAILKLGGAGGTTCAILNSKAVAGYTFEYVKSSYSSITCTARNKLTIKKDGVVSTENFIVQVSPCISLGAASTNIVAAYHDSLNSADYFENDAENIIITVGSDNEAVAVETNLIATIYKI